MYMEQLININWDEVECHICGSTSPFAPIKVNGAPLTDGQFGYGIHPVICECGFVFLSPRWSKKDYDVFYENYYDDLYRLEIKPDYGIEGVVNNMRVIWRRIEEMVASSIENVLDIGCGSGYGLKFIKDVLPGVNIYGIESSPQCCETLVSDSVGGRLLTRDFDDDWAAEHSGEMDLIIMRHSIEHMLSPVQTLKRVRNALSEDGLIYISTPDMMHPRIALRDYDNWWEYWFRVVHPYYYCKETLFKTLGMAGLYPVAYGEENEEVWCLASKEKTEEPLMDQEGESLFKRQIEVLNKYLP